MLNPMMMSNMYTQGNMMMSGGMYPNMMMPNTMMTGGMMPSAGMEMMSSTGMEMMPQSSIDLGAIPNPSLPTQPSMDMNIMGGMIMDPSMMGMYSGMGDISTVVERKEIILKHCKLTPPDPTTPQPPRRARPPGCRTIFVGGLPDKIRESIVREIFENYGRIHILRLSKKNFCHIRFDRESSVDAAMAISGYQIKLTDIKEKAKDADDMDEDDDSKATTGWLHVDYAAVSSHANLLILLSKTFLIVFHLLILLILFVLQSRDDQNEFERRQRQAMRVQQAQMQQLSAQQEMATRSLSVSSYRRSPSPLRVQPFSSTAMLQLGEKIKNEEHFANALPVSSSYTKQ